MWKLMSVANVASRRLVARSVPVLALLGVIAVSAAYAQQRLEPLTNASVIKLVHAGFKEKTVIAIIHSRPNKFDLNPDRLIELKRNGVTENIILAMLSQDESLPASEDWSDDAFFGGGKRSNQEKNGNQQESSDIFGSSGSSKAQTKGRGMSGSNEGATLTTG